MSTHFDDMDSFQCRMHNAAIVIEVDEHYDEEGFVPMMREVIEHITQLRAERDHFQFEFERSVRDHENCKGYSDALKTELVTRICEFLDKKPGSNPHDVHYELNCLMGSFGAYKSRALRAEARIEEAEKQEPVRKDYSHAYACDHALGICRPTPIYLYKRPIPSLDTQEAIMKAVEEENERCAKIIQSQDVDPAFKNRLSDAIRSRSTKETT